MDQAEPQATNKDFPKVTEDPCRVTQKLFNIIILDLTTGFSRLLVKRLKTQYWMKTALTGKASNNPWNSIKSASGPFI